MAAMIRRLAFRFDGRASPVRAWDIRFRVAAVVLVSAGVLSLPPASLLPLSVMVVAGTVLAGSRWRETAAVVWGFAPFLAFLAAVGLAFDPSAAQAAQVGIQALRLTLLLLLGHTLALSATPADVTEGIRWYLGWLGKRRAWAAASMAGWALASVPLVLEQAATLLDAAVLRGLTPGRHPLKTVKLLTLGLLVRTVERSTDLASALEARGYGQSVPPPSLRSRPADAVTLAAVATTLAASWGFGSILFP